MSLGETVIYCGPEGCSYETVSLYRLCVPNVFGERAGSAADPGPALPQCVLATITLVAVGGWGVLEKGEAGAGPRGKVGLVLRSLAVTALLGVESDPSC